MSKQGSTEVKKFLIPDSPLEVKLSIHRDQPPILRVVIAGPKRDEHKDPRYTGAVGHLVEELKSYIAISGWFPPQGRIVVDPYASEEVSLHIRYPSDPPPSQSLLAMLVLDPIRRSQRSKKNKKNSETLFSILSERMPVFTGDLKTTLDNDRLSSARGSHGPHSREIKMDKDRKEAYDLLGVKPDTPWETIKRTYHDKARIAHPDAKGGVDDGSFHKLQNAYEMIKKWHNKSGK